MVGLVAVNGHVANVDKPNHSATMQECNIYNNMLYLNRICYLYSKGRA